MEEPQHVLPKLWSSLILVSLRRPRDVRMIKTKMESLGEGGELRLRGLTRLLTGPRMGQPEEMRTKRLS